MSMDSWTSAGYLAPFGVAAPGTESMVAWDVLGYLAPNTAASTPQETIDVTANAISASAPALGTPILTIGESTSDAILRKKKRRFWMQQRYGRKF